MQHTQRVKTQFGINTGFQVTQEQIQAAVAAALAEAREQLLRRRYGNAACRCTGFEAETLTKTWYLPNVLPTVS